MDELAWREAMVRAGGPDNADRLWPVLGSGLGDLLQVAYPVTRIFC